MQPLYFTIDQDLPLMIIPDADAHMDGHPVLTYSYTIYRYSEDEDDQYIKNTDKLLAPEKIQNPNYLGMISFEQPGKRVTYTADGVNELSDNEVTEIIEQIVHYRENPNLWSV